MGQRSKSVQFRREREAGWVELEKLLEHTEKSGLGKLSARELERLPQLYRAVISSYSVAGAISLDTALRRYLAALAQRAYIWVYGVRRPLRHGVWRFFAEDFPRAVRNQRWPVAVSAALMLLATVVSFVMVSSDMSHYFSFVPDQFREAHNPYADTDELRTVLFGETEELGGLGYFTSMLFTNNTRVALLAFALGIAGGIPTAGIMLNNGLTLGAITALYVERGLGWEVFGWLLVHGVTELAAVILAGAAGLTIGRAVLAPGRWSRGEALKRAGRQAGLIAMGCACMLLVAAFMEGFTRQLLDSTPLRWVWAMSSLALWLVYFTRAGRSSR